MTKEDALKWFRLGFEASGEGCNGEVIHKGTDYQAMTAGLFEEDWSAQQVAERVGAMTPEQLDALPRWDEDEPTAEEG